MTVAVTPMVYAGNVGKVRAHLDAECSNSIENILGTVGEDARFAVLWPQDGGKMQLGVCLDMPSVEEHYRGLRSSLDVLSTTQTKRVVGDWYVLQQSVAMFQNTKNESGVPFPIDTVVLFPIAPGGIKGEFCWNRTSFPEAERTGGRQVEATSEQLLPLVDRHNAFIEAWRTGDPKAMMEHLTSDCVWATRDYRSESPHQSMLVGRGQDEVAAVLEKGLAGWHPQDSIVLNRVVADWVVFTEILWLFEDGGGIGGGEPFSVRTGTVSGVAPDGRFLGVIGFGTDPFPAAL
jgi:hypothetical protein